MSDTKKCRVCGGNQLVEKFKPDRRSKDGLAAICVPCLEERETRVIFPAEHEVMFVRQGQGCAVCKRRIFLSKILVDYDRRTTEVFGLVCRPCNRALRDLKRDSIIVKNMLEYLKTAYIGGNKMKYEGKDYQVRDYDCKKCKSFLPFSGNGRYICRLYELGKCPKPKE